MHNLLLRRLPSSTQRMSGSGRGKPNSPTAHQLGPIPDISKHFVGADQRTLRAHNVMRQTRIPSKRNITEAVKNLQWCVAYRNGGDAAAKTKSIDLDGTSKGTWKGWKEVRFEKPNEPQKAAPHFYKVRSMISVKKEIKTNLVKRTRCMQFRKTHTKSYWKFK